MVLGYIEKDKKANKATTGNWTPVLSSDGGTAPTYSGGAISGYYLKMDSIVNLFLQLENINISNVGSGGELIVRGLPFMGVAYTYSKMYSNGFRTANQSYQTTDVFIAVISSSSAIRTYIQYVDSNRVLFSSRMNSSNIYSPTISLVGAIIYRTNQ